MQTPRETKKANTLAKKGTSKEHLNASQPHEFAHSTPYYYQRDDWPSVETTLDKRPIRFLEKYVTKHDNSINLELFPILYPNTEKWIANEKIDNESSNKLWTSKNISNSQKACLLKLKHGQYMGNARKQLFFGKEAFLSITCLIYKDGDSWHTCILISESSFICADEMNHFRHFHTSSAPCLKGFKNTKF